MASSCYFFFLYGFMDVVKDRLHEPLNHNILINIQQLLGRKTSRYCVSIRLSHSNYAEEEVTSWTVTQAWWDINRTSAAWNNLPNPLQTSNKALLQDLYRRIMDASAESIPQINKAITIQNHGGTNTLRSRRIEGRCYARNIDPVELCRIYSNGRERELSIRSW